jgi:hypothetical protein
VERLKGEVKPDAEVEALGKAIASGGPAPIQWEELRAVTLASIMAVRSLRKGSVIDLLLAAEEHR